MNPSLRRSSAHVFVESLNHPELADEDAHHLVRVLRLRHGDPVSASDGRGAWRICRFQQGGGLLLDSEIVTETPDRPTLTIGFALPKADRPEWIVQKLTEIGVDRILILHAERSVARWDDDRAERRLAKLGKIAREAAMQSRRVVFPAIEGPMHLAAALGDDVALAEPKGAPVTLASPTILIGPEGGWTDTELAAASLHVDLGPAVLRVETAALVAIARLVALRTDGRRRASGCAS